MQREIAEYQQSVYEEGQARQKLQLELDAKDSEIEQLRMKLNYANIDSVSINSGSLDDTTTEENGMSQN